MPQKLIINTDGGCLHNPGPAAIGVVLRRVDGSKVGAISESIGEATNNQAEYRAVIAGMEKALELGATGIQILSDSLLVVQQLNRHYKVKDEALKPLFEKAQSLRRHFKDFNIVHIPREKNLEADRLACQALKGPQNRKSEAAFFVRPASMKDMDGMNRVWAEVEEQHASALPSVFRRVANPARDRGYVAAILADSNSAIFVAELKNAIVGLVQVMLQEAPDVPYMVPRRFAKVSDLVVAKSYRQNGVGSLLLAEAEKWAKNKRAESLELNVYEFNSAARGFYENLGFTTASRLMWKDLRVTE
jgi:ribonuclease HI/GNAT superfamily N-acetyltransferase